MTALFTGALTVDPAAAATALVARTAAGETRSVAADIFGSVHEISGSNPARDETEEEAVEKLAELVTVRQNYFTVIVCAQTIRDIQGVSYDHDGDPNTPPKAATYGTVDMERNAAGAVTRYIDRVVAEQKIMAVLYRDACANTFRIERYAYLD